MALSFRSLASAAAVLALLYGAPGAAQTITPADAEAIRGVVREYQQAADRRDGAAAARLVTRDTRGYYGRMRDMAVSAPEQQVRAAPLMDRFTILLYRHRVPADELRALPADSAFAYTIRAGWVAGDAEDDVAAQGEIVGQGDRAVLRIEEEEIHFLREDGAWRWDMMPSLLAASEAFAPDPDSGMTEDEFVMFVLKHSDGRDPSPDIWQPLP
ncbi:MAG TPA: hypothetical protein VF006_29235 [Longimicrobium sp.]